MVTYMPFDKCHFYLVEFDIYTGEFCNNGIDRYYRIWRVGSVLVITDNSVITEADCTWKQL